MTTQGKQISPADTKADTQGLPSVFCGCCCSTVHLRILPQSLTLSKCVFTFFAMKFEKEGEVQKETERMREMCVRDCGLKARQSAVPFSGPLWHFCWVVVTHGGRWWRTCDRNADPVGQSNHHSADTSVSAGSCANSRNTHTLLQCSRYESLTSPRMFKQKDRENQIHTVTPMRCDKTLQNNPGSGS